MKNKKREIVLMDFSGIYRQERFYEGRQVCWVDVRALPGSNCYCDETALCQIREKIREFPSEGIHFIDSGNYHYMSRIWTEKIQGPFRLLVFDNHTDMQPPAFGGILSCGGWLAAAIRELPFLQEVYLAGPDEKSFLQTEEALRKKVRFLSREELQIHTLEENIRFFREIPSDLPLYVSVDKDVLCPGDAGTVWSQGDMRLRELLEYLGSIKTLAGMDVCGEWDYGQAADSSRNDACNRAFLELYEKTGTAVQAGAGGAEETER